MIVLVNAIFPFVWMVYVAQDMRCGWEKRMLPPCFLFKKNVSLCPLISTICLYLKSVPITFF